MTLNLIIKVLTIFFEICYYISNGCSAMLLRGVPPTSAPLFELGKTTVISIVTISGGEKC